MKFITKHFIQGIAVLLPVALTAYLFYVIFVAVDGLGTRILSVWISKRYIITGIGFFLTVFLVTCAGYASSIWIGSPVFRWIENQFRSSSITRVIYGAIRDTTSAIMGRDKILSKVVLVNFPNLGFKRIGFVTQESSDFADDGDESTLVYFPHSFQISGNILIVPKSNVKFLDISTEKALKTIMSAGIVKS